jgi:hypothetical protein
VSDCGRSRLWIALSAKIVEEHAVPEVRWEVLSCVFDTGPVENDTKLQGFVGLDTMAGDKDELAILGYTIFRTGHGTFVFGLGGVGNDSWLVNFVVPIFGASLS